MARDLYRIRWLIAGLTLTIGATAPVGADVTSVHSSAELRSLAGGGIAAGIHDVTQDLGTDLPSYEGELEVTPLSGMRNARALSSQTSRIAALPDAIDVDAQGSTDIAAETNFDENFVGAGGNVSFVVSFTLTTRASFTFFATASVATNGTDASSDAGVTFSCDCADEADPDCQAFDLEIDAEDSPDHPPTASESRSGLIGPGSCTISAGTSSSLGLVNQTSRTSFLVTLAVSASPDGVCEGPVSRWIGGKTGAFDDPANWDAEVPTFGTGDGECEEALFDAGRIVDISGAPAALAAGGAALGGRARAPRAGGTHTAGRLHVRRVKELRVRSPLGLTLADGALDKASVVVDGKATLGVTDGGVLEARHAHVGEVGKGAVFVSGPGSAFDVADVLTIGARSDGSVQFVDGSTGEGAAVRIGDGAPGSARVARGASWHTGDLALGFHSPGTLTVEEGGEVVSGQAAVGVDLPAGPVPAFGRAPHACLGRKGGAAAEVVGTSSAWRVDTLAIGGLGCVEVGNEGGLVTTAGSPPTGDLLVGTTEAGEGALLVDDGVVLVAGDLVVGESGPGEVVVTEGVATQLAVAGATLIGSSLPPAGRGHFEVNGKLSTPAASFTSGSLRIPDGDTGTGELTLHLGSRIHTDTTAEVGTDATDAGRGTEGTGTVALKGPDDRADLGAGSEELTRWEIGQALTIGAPTSGRVTGRVTLHNATIVVGTVSTPGTLTIARGGELAGFGQLNTVFTLHGTIENDGVIQGPMALEGSYTQGSTGELDELIGSVVLPPAAPLTAGVGGTGGARAAKAPPLAQGPVVIDGDADLGNTTLVLQFVNGFAPRQGDVLPVVEVSGQMTGTFANVEVRGLAPGAMFDVGTMPGMAIALTDAVALPVVTLKAPKRVVEGKKSGAKVKFTRTGDRSLPLSVHYRVAGSAEEGFDYVSLPGVLEIPAKKKSAKLVIQPLADGFVEPTETIEIELLPGDDYAPSTVSKVTIELLSKDKTRRSR
jgi:T5SS/PEP-CTERM-associated repeat protein